jgi:hypothetical protein
MSKVHRNYQVVDVESLSASSDDSLPQTVVRFASGYLFDLGALCYAKRGRLTVRRENSITAVDASSVDRSRFPAVLAISALLRVWVNEGKTLTYMVDRCRVLMSFMDWCEAHGHTQALASGPAATNAIQEYFNFTVERCKAGEIGFEAARTKQYRTLGWMSAIHGGQVVEGVDVITSDRTALKGCAGPDQGGEIFILTKRCTPIPKKVPAPLAVVSRWTTREYKLVAVEKLLEVPEVDIHTVVVQFENNRNWDLGAICFLDRDDSRRNPVQICSKVDVKSLDRRRLFVVKRTGDLIATKVVGGLRHSSAIPTVGRYLDFIKFCDQGRFRNPLFDREQGEEAITAYFLSIAERHKRHDITGRHARALQTDARELVQWIFDDERLACALVPIEGSRSRETSTPPPDEDQHGRVLALSEALFAGGYALSCERAQYPYRMEMPKYLPWPRHFVWVFPKTNWFNPHMTLLDEKSARDGHIAYDYVDGRIKSEEEATRITNRGNARELILRATNRLAQANVDPRDPARLRLASLAHNVFFLMFLSNTGMNFTQARELEWSDDYKVEAERQKFRVIKWRAGGKECKFEIEIVFLPLFKKFLEIRKFLLGSNSHSNLFISTGTANDVDPHPVAEAFLSSVYGSLAKIDPSIAVIKSRALRAAKGDFAVRTTDVATGASLLQNSEATFEKSYTAGSESVASEELGSFFDSLTTAAKVVAEKEDSLHPVPAGQCKGYGKAIPIMKEPPVPVQCDRSEGCVFCESYRVHADEIDVRKILSCWQYLEYTSSLAESKEEFDKAFRKIFGRLTELLAAIEARVPGLVARVRNEVDEGNLAPYWRGKVELLIDCGVV